MSRASGLLTAAAIAAASVTVAAQALAADPAVRSGGIGLEERAALNAERDRYNLRLAFAETDGEYVADVSVRLSTLAGRLVYAGDAEGPFLFARLDPGRYRLEAEYAGVTQVRSFNVGATQVQPYIYLHWPAGAPDAEPSG